MKERFFQSPRREAYPVGSDEIIEYQLGLFFQAMSHQKTKLGNRFRDSRQCRLQFVIHLFSPVVLLLLCRDKSRASASHGCEIGLEVKETIVPPQHCEEPRRLSLSTRESRRDSKLLRLRRAM